MLISVRYVFKRNRLDKIKRNWIAVIPGINLDIASQFFVSKLVKSDDAIRVFRMRSRVTPTRDDGSTPLLFIVFYLSLGILWWTNFNRFIEQINTWFYIYIYILFLWKNMKINWKTETSMIYWKAKGLVKIKILHQWHK